MKQLSSYDYYWRDYKGEIPKDAVEGGQDLYNKKIYIGQVYVKNQGLIPVTIYPGKTSVAAATYGVHHLSHHIKILCSSRRENFKWVPADAKNLHTQTINKHVVPGGVEHDMVCNIGRISYQGEVIVSKVCGYKVGNAKLHYPAGNKEQSVDSYEVLIFDYYYWRDYTGNIPRDAVEGGRDGNNRTTYIGQVFVKNYGIIPATIYPGNTSVVAVVYGLHHVKNYIKILCSGSKQNLKWMYADSKNFHVQTTNRHLVRGGVEVDIVSYIGKIRYQNETIVSKVREHGIGNVKFYYPAGNQEKSSDSYEVLIYDR